MSHTLALLALLAVAPVAPVAVGGKFNKALGVGDAAPAWADLEGTDGAKHALADLKGKAVVVVAFTCNSCPVARDYEDRLIALGTTYAAADSSVAVVAVNVNTGKDDALPAMTARAAKRKFPFAYLYDPSQEIARKYGAAYTPEVFVLGRDRKVVYLGAFDDKAPPGEPAARHVEDAVRAALAGTPAAPRETSASAGCRIKFAAKKRDE